MRQPKSRLIFKDHLGREYERFSPYQGAMAASASRRALKLKTGIKGKNLVLVLQESLLNGPISGPRKKIYDHGNASSPEVPARRDRPV